jgi:uncharacterized membrane protein
VEKKIDEAQFAEGLKRELPRWVEGGLVTGEQAARVMARYADPSDIVSGSAEASDAAAVSAQTANVAGRAAGSARAVAVPPSRFIATVSTMGVIMIGVGIILFMASNWSEIPKWGKLAIIFASMLASYASGFYMAHVRGDFPRAGAALIFLGAIIYGAGIYLIAQMYHISVHYPNGALMWALGALPIAYILGHRAILTLSLLVLLLWLGVESRFWVINAPLYGDFISVVMLYLMAGLMLWNAGLLHREAGPYKTLAGPYVAIGILVSFACAFIFTFEVYREGHGAPELWMFYLAVYALFAAALAGRLFIKDKTLGRFKEMAALCAMMALALLFAAVLKIPTGKSIFKYMTIANLIFAAAVMGVIYLGYMRRNPLYINVGLTFFALDVCARYFDFFWTLLPRSLFFVVSGIMLVSGGIYLEKKRRALIASFKTQVDATREGV